MKKILMLLTALAAWCSSAMADGLVVQNVIVSQGGAAILDIALDNPTNEYAAFQFNIQLAEGITVATNDKGKLVYERGDRLDEDFSLSMSLLNQESNTYRVLGYYTETQAITGTSGTIIRVTIQADASLLVSSEHTCQLTAINLTEPDETKHTPDPISFKVTIDSPADGRLILSETATTAPEAATGVNVRVKRTIKADQWSTICLPFAMTKAQVEAAFGDFENEDVILADFTGIETEYDTDDNVISICVKFNYEVEAIEANHPYLIKVKEAVSEFTVDGVDINPANEPSVNRDEKAVNMFNTWIYFYNRFVGTYVANTDVPQNCLFLNNSKFYYSTGSTKMKAFRAYFKFLDVLPDIEASQANIRLSFDDRTTTINEIDVPNVLKGVLYNLNGQLVGKDVNLSTLPKGIYVVDGKKVEKY